MDISDLLLDKGFETPGALLHVSDTELSRAGFKVGHIAELKWALRKMVGEELQAGATTKKPNIYGAPEIMHCASINLRLMFHRRPRGGRWSGWS
jgi:hypothetical protein